eukprot:scaffold634089_cov18-Prasinocladus_malaysianus.AAC.1
MAAMNCAANDLMKRCQSICTLPLTTAAGWAPGPRNWMAIIEPLFYVDVSYKPCDNCIVALKTDEITHVHPQPITKKD